jgi:hypothetical protein
MGQLGVVLVVLDMVVFLRIINGVEVCETKNSIDYKIVSNWIDNH